MLPQRLNQWDPTAALPWSTEVDLFREADALRVGAAPVAGDQITALATIVNQQRMPRPARPLPGHPAGSRRPASPGDSAGAGGRARRRRPVVRPWVLGCAIALAATSVALEAVAHRSGRSATPAAAPTAQEPVAIAVTTAEPAALALPAPGPSAATIPASAVTGPPGAVGAAGIPAIPLSAYQRAAARMARGCAVPWWLLAGVGKVETDHAVAGRVDRNGKVRGQIFGPRLDGSTPGTQTVTDTDKGSLDGDPQFDRAVGPMQFLPATWVWAKRDGNGDGQADPQNVYDAALAAAVVLCQAGPITDEPSMTRALLRYNGSLDYAQGVLSAALAYRDATTATPTATATATTQAPATSGPTSAAPAGTAPAATSPTPRPTATTPANPTTTSATATPGTSTATTAATTQAP